jgi:hypothetical protein
MDPIGGNFHERVASLFLRIAEGSDRPSPRQRLLSWLSLGTSKFHDWKHRHGKAKEHNGMLPRDWWLDDWEVRAIINRGTTPRNPGPDVVYLSPTPTRPNSISR